MNDASPLPRRVRLAGLGLVTPLASGAWPNFSALLAGRTLADRLAKLEPDTEPMPRVLAIGGVANARFAREDPAIDLAETAAREACLEAGVEAKGLAVYLGTSKGAAAAHAAAADRLLGGPDAPPVRGPDAEAVAMGPHALFARGLARRLGVAVADHRVAACAASLVALDAAARGVASGRLDAALVVTAEAALLPLFVHAHARLGVLAPLDDYAGRPLSAARRGFVLAESAAAVVLTADDRPGIELVATAVAADGFDLLRPAPGMPALRRVAGEVIRTERVACLHPHAPGTPTHDPMELAALASAAADAPAVYAAKGAIGHGLGAAGLGSLVLAALCARANRRPPMPWIEQPLDTPLDLSPETRDLPDGLHAVFAAGFGGHVAAASLRVGRD
ncbi:beta-ketoacyl synthase N-terminal-like domain-containing protein [Phycisphaera mikurensis]|uniref:Putative 3-oxoacyl-[acyl-carrier-protein] synthase II n=1 Tax=Phycisphaera mikurensis (strain NBRC 102666 / KCTC 22515 / FYK2301M01) TaxID=1142394 RepID=I0ID61_PHYMF|nr:beta-ketoacyl synthase N-terminal-like domain-containing protein [Phycisphaera mikurensis]MBB6442323.1 3-oxoacyl-(acyl-carrier-protein) synthase [Phycisphaera mikurensis]BAM03199.1 putative 3-oxoacyl-[acyl-carrier-protein] synthase II [Phycisphaera mikurensis NBRC 102666]